MAAPEQADLRAKEAKGLQSAKSSPSMQHTIQIEQSLRTGIAWTSPMGRPVHLAGQVRSIDTLVLKNVDVLILNLVSKTFLRS